jgi:acyl-CoA dehydrogenase
VIMDEINKSGGHSAASHAQMYTMGALLRHGSDQQKNTYLPLIAKGELRLQAFPSPNPPPVPTPRASSSAPSATATPSSSPDTRTGPAASPSPTWRWCWPGPVTRPRTGPAD